VIDLDAYLKRIGVRGRPSLAETHRAHVTSIPFENLDPHRGVPVSLEQEDLERKLVRERRGGYCFEQNLLLKAALEALGLRVDLLLARVRVGAPAGAIRPRSHLVLRVHADGAIWHADVGFGTDSPFEPLPFGPGGPFEQFGWRYRVVQDGPELVLQNYRESGWADLYGYAPEAVPRVDVETSNWFTATHPRSPFVTGLIVAQVRRDGARLSLSDWDGVALAERTPDREMVTPVARESIPELLASRFGLPGFRLDQDGRIAQGAMNEYA
jgi:N-hydroxyarylamine O-acetyltransferase